MKIATIATLASAALYQVIPLAAALGGRSDASNGSYFGGLATFMLPFVLLMAAEALGLSRRLARLCAGIGIVAIVCALFLVVTDQGLLAARTILLTLAFLSLGVLLCTGLVVWARAMAGAARQLAGAGKAPAFAQPEPQPEPQAEAAPERHRLCLVTVSISPVEGGPATTRELGEFHAVWEKGVSIGSDEGCEVVLPGVAPVAAIALAVSNHKLLYLAGSPGFSLLRNGGDRPQYDLRVDTSPFDIGPYRLQFGERYPADGQEQLPQARAEEAPSRRGCAGS